MMLCETQYWLARLFTDEAVLRQFLADRGAFTRNLQRETADFLHKLDARQIEHFVSALHSKRARDASKMIPLLSGLLGRRFEPYFFRFAVTAIPAGPHKPASDAMAFCAWLRARPELEGVIREAACYERLRLSVPMKLESRGSRPFRFRALPRRGPVLFLKRFSRDFPCLDHPSAEPQERPTWTLFANLPGLKGIWYW